MIVTKQLDYLNSNLKSGQGELQKADIVDNYRKMFFFIDKSEFLQLNDINSGLLTLINFSLSKRKYTPYANYGTHLRFVVNFYTFRIEFINGFKDKDNAVCTLLDAYCSDAYLNLDTQRYHQENQVVYDRNISLNNEVLKDMLISFENNCFDVIPDPKYYTTDHQFVIEKEPPQALNTIYSPLIYSVKELKDDKTYMSILDIRDYQTFKESKLRTMNDFRDNYSNDATSLAEQVTDIFSYNSEVVLEGLIYTYDSSIGKSAIEHTNKWAVTMSFSQHRPDQLQIQHMLTLKERIEDLAKRIEKEHGNILLFYCPFAHGDEIKVHFRDYNPENQPIMFDSPNVDKPYSLTTMVSSIVGENLEF